MKSYSNAELGFVRVASCSPAVRVADVTANVAALEKAAKAISEQGAQFCVFPELCLTGYTCGDLFLQPQLLRAAQEGLIYFSKKTSGFPGIFMVGLPLEIKSRLYNAVAVVYNGNIHGFVIKSFLPNNQEFYEKRWFSPAEQLKEKSLFFNGSDIPAGNDLLFSLDDNARLVFGIEVCEDLWSMLPQSSYMAVAGANLIFNPSASNEVLGKKRFRRELVSQQSARCITAYVYAGAGSGESSTDTVFGGQLLIAENGNIIAESLDFSIETRSVLADIDFTHLEHERLNHASFSSVHSSHSYRQVKIPFSAQTLKKHATAALVRPIARKPFVPEDRQTLAQHCQDIFEIQTAALVKRLHYTGSQSLVIGISGGLDSTLALIVAVSAFAKLGLDKKGLIAVTMPGPGTSNRTRNNAEMLITMLDIGKRNVSIVDAVASHLSAIGHPEGQHDITFENAQARERTQILMNIANQMNGFVLGTGDLSEIALGWSTFNGDHMSMYHVNSGVPKTLVRSLVEWAAESQFEGSVRDVLMDIAATPISPELLPPAADGSIAQETEKTVGPYILHDFFLYYFIRQGATPAKIVRLAEQAFETVYDRETIIHWLKVFIRRFFSQQFKRSAMPDGPKVGTVALSPRSDWRMPSDASPATWLDELDS